MNMGPRIKYVLVACLLLAHGLPANAGDRADSIVNCDIQNRSCVQVVTGSKVILDILPKPVKAMQDLTFRVTIDGSLDISKQPYIDLNMPAMNMGRNRVVLRSVRDGVFEGRGVIVRCISGLKTWQAKITFPGAGRAYFIFDVEY